MKGINPLIAFVLTILISFVAVTLAIKVIKPSLDRAKAYSVVNEAVGNLNLINSAVNEVASEAQGSKRTISLTVTDGVYRVDPDKELIYFDYTPAVDLKLSGRLGDIWMERGLAYGEWFNWYEAGDYWTKISGDWTIESDSFKGINGTAYYYLNKNLKDFTISGDIQNDNGKGEIWVEPVDPKNLVLFLPFDEGSSTVAHDYSGHSNNGTLYNDTQICANPPTTSGPDYCPTWVNGKYGTAVSFDGTDDYVEVPDSTSLHVINSFTLTAWVKVNDSANYRGVITKTETNYPAPFDTYVVSGTNTMRFLIGNGTVSQSIDASGVVFNTWQFWTFVYDGTNIIIYLNGNLVSGPTAVTVPVGDTGKSVRIGNRNDGNTPMNGTIDEVRIYNISLTADQIKALYEAGLEKLSSSGTTQTISSQFSPYIVLSNSYGTTYFDNIRINQNHDKNLKLIIPYNTVDLVNSTRISKGSNQISISNVGFNDTSQKPMVQITVG